MYRKILILVAILLLLSGCQKNPELVELYKMSSQIFETMRGETEQGVYMIESSKEQFIIYYGVEKGIKTMSSSVSNQVLTLLFETEEQSKPQYYIYKVTSDSSFDSIQVSVDGSEEAFHTVFVQ